MPTDLPTRRLVSPRSTRAGDRFLACAVLAMLAISVFLLLLPDGVQPS